MFRSYCSKTPSFYLLNWEIEGDPEPNGSGTLDSDLLALDNGTTWRLQLFMRHENDYARWFSPQLVLCQDDNEHANFTKSPINVILNFSYESSKKFKHPLNDKPIFHCFKRVGDCCQVFAIFDSTKERYRSVRHKSAVSKRVFHCQIEFQDDLHVELIKRIAQWYDSAEGSDFKILVGNREKKVHRFMLTLWSPVFKAMLETDSLEKNSGEMEIVDSSEEAVEAFLAFFYTTSVPNLDGKDLEDLWILADRYQVGPLTKLCEKRLTIQISIESIHSTMGLALAHGLTSLLEAAKEFLERNMKELENSGDMERLKADYPAVIQDILSNRLVNLKITKA